MEDKSDVSTQHLTEEATQMSSIQFSQVPGDWEPSPASNKMQITKTKTLL